MALGIESKLLSTNARYPIARVAMKYLTIGAQETARQFDSVYSGQLPDRITMCIVRDAAMNGGYQQNPYNFEHLNVNQLVLYVNGEMYPTKPFAPNFATGQYIREFNNMFQALGYLYTDKSVPISRSEFANGFTIWAFDLTVDQSASRCTSPRRNGSVSLDIRFSAPTPVTINVICDAQFDSLIEIDKNRNVLINF